LVIEDFLGISAFGGIGLNLSHTSSQMSNDDLPPLNPISLIVGAEGSMFIDGLNMFAGLQYNPAFGDPGPGNTVVLYFGAGWYMPFRK
jgi:hypothetical protein